VAACAAFIYHCHAPIVLAHLKDFVGLGTVAVIDGEHEVLEHLLGRLRLRLLRLVLGQGSVAVHDAVEARHVVILPLVRSLQLLHHGVNLRLLPSLVLLHAALVQRLSLPQKHLVLGLKVAAAVVNLLRRPVVVGVRQQSKIAKR